MEKNGKVKLTKEDLDLFKKGQVSDRLKHEWNLTFEDLSEIINHSEYSLENNKRDAE